MNQESSDKGRFRRPDWEAVENGDVDSAENLPSAPADRAREIGMVLGPMRDLADAFRENSEALRSLAEGQQRMARKIDRKDRSEAVIQSTKALNDTFRGVRKTQERLMGRLEKEQRRPFLFLAVATVAVALLVGGTLWAIMRFTEDRGREDGALRETTFRETLEKRELRIEDLRAELTAKSEDLVRQEGIAREERNRRHDLETEIETLRGELADERLDAASLSDARRENARLLTEVDRQKEEASGLRADLKEAEAENARIRADLRDRDEKLAELARRAALAPGAVTDPTAGDLEEAMGDAPIPADAVTGRRDLDRAVNILNGLLAGVSGTESYRVVSVGGIRGKVLYDVVVRSEDASGRELKRIEAGEGEILLDEGQDRAEMRFRNGFIHYYGVKAPFWGGKYIVPLANVDVAAWKKSGLTMLGRAN